MRNVLGKILSAYDNVVVGGHTRPDSDCVGASMAMGMALVALGKNVYVCLEPYSDKFSVIAGQELLKGQREIKTPYAYIALDCGSKDRLGNFQQIFDDADYTLNIDHHAGNTNFADDNFVEPNMAATSEMVYRIVKELGRMNKDIATAIYSGILYDTGGFKHKSTTSGTHLIAAELISLGVPFNDIHTKMLSKTFKETMAYGIVINNLQIVEGYPIVHGRITQEQMRQINITVNQLDGIVDFIFSIKEASVAIFIYEREDGEHKVSLRSEWINVGKIARMLGGGGHDLASGCIIKADFSSSLKKLIDIIKKEMDDYE